MKTYLLATLALALSVATALPARSADAAAALLRRHGSVPVSAAGPHVALGTFRVQVSAKLGSPDATLPDGTWLYRNRQIEGSAARGTLVVRFNSGRVSELLLADEPTVAALRADPAGATGAGRFAEATR